MTSKKRNTLLAIIFILILIVGGSLYYLTTYKFNDKKDNNKTQNNTNLISNTEANTIFDIVAAYDLFGLKYTNGEVTFTNSNVTTDSMLEVLYALILEKGEISGNNLDNYFLDLYNFNPVAKKAYICELDNEELLGYDLNENKYYINENHPAHGEKIYEYLDYKIVSAVKDENNLYKLSVVFLYGNNAEGYYINDDEFDVVIDEEDTENINYDELYKKQFKSMNDFKKYKKYTYTFEKVDNSYFLRGFNKTN